MNILFYIIGSSLFLFFAWFSIVSFLEKERLALFRGLLLTFFLPLPFFLFIRFPFQRNLVIEWVIVCLIGIAQMLIALPIRYKRIAVNENPFKQFDERDTMFSRNEIVRNPKRQHNYYQSNPEKKELDKIWQEKPGLMNEKSTYYSEVSFAAANASFFSIEQLRAFVDGEVKNEKKTFAPQEMSLFISQWAKKMGAFSVGICRMKDHHFYATRGRGEDYGKRIDNQHKYGIVFTVEMDKELLATGPAGPTLMESARQYLNSGSIAIQLAKFIREQGYEARAHIDGNYEVICPLVARDAGLGEIGRMGLLMSPQLGPRVRIAVVTTTIPLKATERNRNNSIHSFCTICKKCAELCPGNAIPKGNMESANGIDRWQVKHENCFNYWCISGTDCGRCMSVCPYSHPNNLLHNLVRYAIRNNSLFARVALKMDDFFYGHKPNPTKIPKWIDIHPTNK